jgi:flagellar assembly protein FliH
LFNIIKSPLVKSGKKVIINNNGMEEVVDDKNKIDDDQLSIERDKLLKNAKDEAESIISQAQAEARDILTKAEEEATSLKSQAQQEIEAAIDEGKSEGYHQGLQAGREEGLNEGVIQLQELISSLNKKMVDFNQSLVEREAELKEDLLRLAVAISKKVIGRELKIDSELLKGIIQRTISLLDGEEEIVIKVAPSDLEVLADYKQELLSSNNSLERVKIVSDEGIKSGGCIIETDFGGFDATIASQLAEVEAKLLEVDNDE